jgi:hypothetical protein
LGLLFGRPSLEVRKPRIQSFIRNQQRCSLNGVWSSRNEIALERKQDLGERSELVRSGSDIESAQVESPLIRCLSDVGSEVDSAAVNDCSSQYSPVGLNVAGNTGGWA